ncbi:type II secretion system protein GspD [Desulfosarcina ovata subsp. sediminis]|uniref:Type II secretion system protein GspD n=1 Tax=Desulfosarcina ovata subsp. sediminis TaxID=885957 RepID=A0A5K7ZD85_9BACT|nr:type II secretion system secretin GspD [Desulfosarcina ovata]BBO80148.1 type II secretion system protein GspD [Desulfosarcina ovata subsp. sediminis]
MTIQTQMIPKPKRTLAALVAGMIFFLFATGLSAQEAPSSDAASPNGARRFVSIDFNNVDISVFIKFISELTGKNFIIDQRVKGKVTIISPSKISVDEAFKVFESVLEVHGFATVETGQLIKIIPSPDARTKNIETRIHTRGDQDNDQVVTQLIPLRFADPDEVKRLFTPMVSKSSVILSYAPTNTLIVTDNYSNIARLMKILKTIDIPGVGREITIFPIHNADAAKLVSLLETVFKTSAQGQSKKRTAASSDRTAAFVADERTNSIITVASEDDTNRIRSLVDTLDQATPKGKEKIHVYYLEYAVAEEIVAVLKDLPTEEQKKSEGGAKKAPVVSENVKITADKATNSLIITASRDDYDTLLEIIRQIDIPRRMVYIEALIMEVNAEKSFELGTEWIVGDDFSIDSDKYQGAIGGGFSTDESNLSTISSGALPSGFSLGILSEAITIGDGDTAVTFPGISAIVNAYKKNADVNILSTPQLLTTDNEEASITVGKNVPYQTTTSTSSSSDTYNSYEYRDVGKTLKITPQINKDRMVRLNLSLEVSSLADATSTTQPTTYKRTVETTVMVNDGSTVVIGGLIDDTFSQTEYKVPCLGDIPGLGWLFRTRAKGNDKTNLFIFITPKVIENPREATAVSDAKKSSMDEMRELKIKLYQGDDDGHAPPPPADIPHPDPEVSPVPDVAPSAGPLQEEEYRLQVQSVADEQSALESMERLVRMGYPAHVTQIELANKIWYRVQVGGFPNRASAEEARDALSAKGFTDTLVIKSNP